MFLAFSFPHGGDLKPLPPDRFLSRVPIGLFSQLSLLFPCNPGFLALHFWGSSNCGWLYPEERSTSHHIGCLGLETFPLIGHRSTCHCFPSHLPLALAAFVLCVSTTSSTTLHIWILNRLPPSCVRIGSVRGRSWVKQLYYNDKAEKGNPGQVRPSVCPPPFRDQPCHPA